jgi:hypothetical protein
MNEELCPHAETKEGPRMPLRYGSGATEVCIACGAYRVNLHGFGPWHKGPLEVEIARRRESELD